MFWSSFNPSLCQYCTTSFSVWISAYTCNKNQYKYRNKLDCFPSVRFQPRFFLWILLGINNMIYSIYSINYRNQNNGIGVNTYSIHIFHSFDRYMFIILDFKLDLHRRFCAYYTISIKCEPNNTNDVNVNRLLSL